MTIVYKVIIYFLKLILLVIDVLDVIFFFIVKPFSKNLKRSVLAKQAVTEEDSAWQIKFILEGMSEDISERAKAGMLNHILEEREHSDLFKENLDSKGKDIFINLNTSRDTLISESKPDKFFVKVGEQAAIQKYKILLMTNAIPKISEIYRSIIEDELEHSENIKLKNDGELKEYLKSYLRYLKTLIGQKLDMLFSLLFSVLLMFFYYLVFFPAAKISNMLGGR